MAATSTRGVLQAGRAAEHLERIVGAVHWDEQVVVEEARDDVATYASIRQPGGDRRGQADRVKG